MIKNNLTPLVSKYINFPVRSYSTKPPSYFSDYIPPANSSQNIPPKSLFEPLSETETSSSTNSNSNHSTSPNQPFQHSNHTNSQQKSTNESNTSKLTPIRDLSIIVSIFTLAYFAVDNYRTRLLLEQKIMNSSLNHMKAIAIAQNNYNNHRKKRELQVLNERRNTQKREMKMVYHISMLRKQLIDAGLKPAEIDEAIKEFEKNVKMETSISNVSGTALWVVDDSPMKGYIPNIHEYESKK